MPKTSKLTKDNPKITVEYDESVKQAEVTVQGPGDSEPIKKKLDLTKGNEDGGDQQQPGQDDSQQDGGQDQPSGDDNNQDGQQDEQPDDSGQQPDEGGQDSEDQPAEDGQGNVQEGQAQIKVTATQDESEPRKVTLKAEQFPEGVDTLTIDWGVQDIPDSVPKELTKDKPEASVKFSPDTKRCTVTVDDEDNPETEPFTKAFKFPKPEQGNEDGGQDKPADDGQQDKPAGEQPADDGTGEENPQQPQEGGDGSSEGDQPGEGDTGQPEQDAGGDQPQDEQPADDQQSEEGADDEGKAPTTGTEEESSAPSGTP